MKKYNLNDEGIPGADPGDGKDLENNNAITEGNFDCVEAIFRDHESKLIDLIKRFEKGAIFGCVAWLTSEPVLKALAKCTHVQIVVQKEDFLRPDSHQGKYNPWKNKLHRLYKNINFSMERHFMKYGVRELSICSDPTVEGVRCVGNHNKDKSPAFPRAHHKFLVFCELENTVETSSGYVKGQYVENAYSYETQDYKPISVWTGSYNITDNATRSFENVIYLEDNSGTNPILEAYLKEHHQILSISEPLDWTSQWCEPEYRIGT